MSPWSAVAKQDAAKGARDDRFLLVHLEALAAPVVLEDLPVAERNRREWNHPVLRHFQALRALMDDRSRVPAPA
jgi:hypothetical protein